MIPLRRRLQRFRANPSAIFACHFTRNKTERISQEVFIAKPAGPALTWLEPTGAEFDSGCRERKGRVRLRFSPGSFGEFRQSVGDTEFAHQPAKKPNW